MRTLPSLFCAVHNGGTAGKIRGGELRKEATMQGRRKLLQGPTTTIQIFHFFRSSGDGGGIQQAALSAVSSLELGGLNGRMERQRRSVRRGGLRTERRSRETGSPTLTQQVPPPPPVPLPHYPLYWKYTQKPPLQLLCNERVLVTLALFSPSFSFPFHAPPYVERSSRKEGAQNWICRLFPTAPLPPVLPEEERGREGGGGGENGEGGVVERNRRPFLSSSSPLYGRRRHRRGPVLPPSPFLFPCTAEGGVVVVVVVVRLCPPPLPPIRAPCSLCSHALRLPSHAY